MNDRLERESRLPGNMSDGRTEYHKFAKDILWITFSQVLISVIMGIVLIPVITKNYSPDVYLIWIQINLWVDLLVPFLSLQLGLAAVRYLAGEGDAQKRRHYLGAMLSAIIIFEIIGISLALPFAPYISNILFNTSGYVNYIVLLLGWTVVNTLYNFLLSYLQARGKNRDISVIQITITILKVIIISTLAIAGTSMGMIIASQIILQLVFLLYLVFVVSMENGVPVPGLSGLKSFLVYSVPFIPGVIFLWIIKNSDRSFLTHFLGLAQSGVYSSSQTIGSLATLFYYPISFVLFSLVSKFWEQGRVDDVKSYFEYSQKMFMIIAIPGVVGIAVLSQYLLTLLATSDYLAGPGLIFLVALGFVFLGIYQMNSTLILLDKRARLLPLILVAGAALSVALNFTLIPRIGVIGAAYGFCSSCLLLALLSTIWAKNIVNYKLEIWFYPRVIASTLLMWFSLNWFKITNVGIALLAILIGVVVYGASLLLLKTFSKKDVQLAKNILAGLIPNKPVK